MGTDEKIKKLMRLIDPQQFKTIVIIVLAIMIAGGLVLLSSYWQAHGQMENISRDLLATRVKENAEQINRTFIEYNQILYSLSVDSNIFWLKNWTEYDYSQRLDRYYKATERISSVRVFDPHVMNIYACFPTQDLVLSDSVYKLNRYTVLTAGERAQLSNTTINLFVQTAAEEETIVIEKIELACKIGYSAEEVGFVVMDLMPDLIADILNNTNDLGGEWIHVTDQAGNMVYNQGGPSDEKWRTLTANVGAAGTASVDGVAYYVVSSPIERVGWTYAMAVPVSNLIDNRYSGLGIVLLVGILAVMAVAFGTLGTKMALRPLEKLYRLVSGRTAQPRQPDRIVYLSRAFERIMGENDDLRGMMNRNLPLLREKVLMQMVMQREPVPLTAGDLDELGLRFSMPWFRIVVICSNTGQGGRIHTELFRVEIFREYWKERLSEIGRCHMVLIQPQRFFILVEYDEAARQNTAWPHWFNDRAREFEQQYGGSITGGISTEKSETGDLNAAFLEASSALEAQMVVGPGFIGMYDQHRPPGEVKMDYPFALVEKLANSLRSGDEDAVGAAFGELCAFIEKKPPRTEFSLKQIFLYMGGTLRQLLLEMEEEILGRFPINEDMQGIMDAQGLDGHIAAFDRLVGHIGRAYRDHLGSRHRQLACRIRHYIEENYHRTMAYEDIADHFHISTTYLYRLMKEELQIAPGSYLNAVRIKKSVEFLTGTDIAVKDIAVRCGFETERSFYRNFKKEMGCTPSQYRERCVRE